MLAARANLPAGVSRLEVSITSTNMYRLKSHSQNTGGKSAMVSHIQENTRMITAKKTLYLYVETPLHAGVGSGLSSIDLPIQRERTTQYPMIQGSGIKGKLRAALEGDREQLSEEEKAKIDILFDPPTTATKDSNNDHAGALIVGDARILLFPVRSLNGVFAYTTSYDVLNRFKRDIERERTNTPFSWDMPI